MINMAADLHDENMRNEDLDIENDLKELASLARLVTFARERAHAVGAEFPAYCLDLALGAILQEVYKDENGMDMPVEERETWLHALPN